MRKIIHAVKGWIKGGSTTRTSAIVYVYASGKDASGGEVNPNDQVNVLRRLSTFSGKENIPVTIIFPGRPSRKIPDGSKQGGVQARYATGDQLRKVVNSAIADARKNHSVVIATNHPDVEKLARSEHFRHIRATTFEKALDAVAGPLHRDQPQQQSPRRQPQPQAIQPAKPQPATAEEAPAAPSGAEPEGEPPQPQPIPQKPESVSRKLHRHDPTMKKEERDQAILDLIDPL